MACCPSYYFFWESVSLKWDSSDTATYISGSFMKRCYLNKNISRRSINGLPAKCVLLEEGGQIKAYPFLPLKRIYSWYVK